MKPQYISSRGDFQSAFGVSRETGDRLTVLHDLLQRWNSRINLVAKGDRGRLWHRHIADSAQLWALAPGNARTWLDIGSGAGFPGLVIAAMAAEHARGPTVHLVESNARKGAFLSAAAREMGLHPRIHLGHSADMIPFQAQVISARALAPLTRLLELARPFSGNGMICLFPKGARLESELTEARKDWHIQAEIIPSLTNASSSVLIVEKFARAVTDAE